MVTLRLVMQDLPMLRMQESEVNFQRYPSSSAGRVGGAHWGEWEVISDVDREVGIRCVEKWGECVTPKPARRTHRNQASWQQGMDLWAPKLDWVRLWS